MSPRPDVSEERKNQILAAATRVFTMHGFTGARMDDIVEESGLSKGALYWYFDSKDAIIIGILDQIFDSETTQLREILEAEDSATKKIELFVEMSIKDLEKMKPLMPIFFDFWSLSVRNPNIKQAIKRYYQNFLDLLTPIIEEGIESGEFSPMDPAEAAVALGSLYEGTILFYIYFPEIIDLKTQFRSNFKLTLEGLIGKP
ncbi:MAG: TetR/AcrR family transcriptional regulator [Anaerolineales bacterium]|jgi:AcrR family transcriptional regulator